MLLETVQKNRKKLFNMPEVCTDQNLHVTRAANLDQMEEETVKQHHVPVPAAATYQITTVKKKLFEKSALTT